MTGPSRPLKTWICWSLEGLLAYVGFLASHCVLRPTKETPVGFWQKVRVFLFRSHMGVFGKEGLLSSWLTNSWNNLIETGLNKCNIIRTPGWWSLPLLWSAYSESSEGMRALLDRRVLPYEQFGLWKLKQDGTDIGDQQFWYAINRTDVCP